MTFTGTGIDSLAIIIFYANSVSAIFLSLDSIQFLDSPFSVLDVFISIMFLNLIIWFVLRIITGINANLHQEARDSAYSTAESRDEERLSYMDVSSTDGDEDLNE